MLTAYSNGQTCGGFTSALQYERNDGAPTGAILADENSLASHRASANSGDIYQLKGEDVQKHEERLATRQKAA